eukprot:COSAG01_NODE_12184_length_1784_cov_1.674184_5_plen_52_part_00
MAAAARRRAQPSTQWGWFNMSGLRMATVELPEERVTMAVEGEEVVLQLQGA